MSSQLHVLIIEDNEDDAALFDLELKRGGYQTSTTVVGTRDEYSQALDDSWDVIIADYRLPGFTGLDALEIMKQRQLDIPFILVSGTIDAATAIRALKAGAQDYIQKGDLSRFVPAVDRELREATLRRARREHEYFTSALNDLHASIHSSLEVDDILEKALEISTPALAAESGAIAVRSGDVWLVKHAHGFERDVVGLHLLDQDVPAEVLSSGTAHVVAIEDVATDSRLSGDLFGGDGIQSVMVAPLTIRTDVVGLLFFGYRTPRSLSESQIGFVRDLTDQISLALTNARLYEQEHKVAEALRKLLTRSVPSIDGLDVAVSYRPARAAENVGGDFYDVFELGEDEVAILIGDVSGKGLEAAAMTETIRSSVRTLVYAHTAPSPAFVFNQLDKSLRRQLSPGEFATALLVIVNSSTGRLRLVSAGHPPPVVCGDKECRFEQPPIGLPLGVFPTVYEESYLELGDGETLVLYTDGVTEARLEGELYGEDRLIETLARLHDRDLPSLSESLLQTAAEYAGGHLTDDAVIVAFRVKLS